MSILDAIFGHTRKNKGLKWTSLFGLKICQIVFKRSFNGWIMVICFSFNNIHTHTHPYCLMMEFGLNEKNKNKKDGLANLIGVKL